MHFYYYFFDCFFYYLLDRVLYNGLGDFRFNKNNGRYLYSFPYGYYDVLPPRIDGESDTPLIEIGKCSPF